MPASPSAVTMRLSSRSTPLPDAGLLLMGDHTMVLEARQPPAAPQQNLASGSSFHFHVERPIMRSSSGLVQSSDRILACQLLVVALVLGVIVFRAFAAMPYSALGAACADAALFFTGLSLHRQISVRRTAAARPLPWLGPVSLGVMAMGMFVVGHAVLATMQTRPAS